MRKLNGSNAITGFQPILCSHYVTCAQEMDQNIIEKMQQFLDLKCLFLPKYWRFKKKCY